MKALLLIIALLASTPAKAKYADYAKEGSLTHSNMTFIYCKLNAKQGNKDEMFKELHKNVKNANENPAWISDQDLIKDAKEAVTIPGFCDSLLEYKTYEAWVRGQSSKGPKHFSSLSTPDQIIALTLSRYMCKYGTGDMSRYDTMTGEINEIYKNIGISKATEKEVWGKVKNLDDGGSVLWLARLRNWNSTGDCSLPPGFDEKYIVY